MVMRCTDIYLMFAIKYQAYVNLCMLCNICFAILSYLSKLEMQEKQCVLFNYIFCQYLFQQKYRIVKLFFQLHTYLRYCCLVQSVCRFWLVIYTEVIFPTERLRRLRRGKVDSCLVEKNQYELLKLGLLAGSQFMSNSFHFLQHDETVFVLHILYCINTCSYMLAIYLLICPRPLDFVSYCS